MAAGGPHRRLLLLPRPWIPALIICFSALFLPGRVRSQAQPTTDPGDAAAFNAIATRWRSTPPTWNTTADPCTGAATDGTDFDKSTFNPFIKCVCTFQNRTICRITKLKYYALDVRGPVPAELQNLTMLNNLNLAQNYLTGPLPAFIGSFSNMEYMTFGINALSGSIPKEIGNLTRLKSLGISSNSFNGSLPAEIGNLAQLEQLYMDSAGLSGEIPSTFSQLQNLKIIWGSDNSFTGTIPDFIGGLTNLNTLRFQGNSFQGPIPTSFSQLTNLTDLRIGDLTNVSSSLGFIQNMSSLSTLILRNCKVSGTIPSNMGIYTELKLLDLSFNNLSGQLPQSIFSLNKLELLFLGNNSLSGSLPVVKNANPLNIDLSYNNLSGSFPSWVTQRNLKLNLVANDFVLSSDNNSVLASGLDCLQKGFPCNRNSPVWSQVAVNCGGSKAIISSEGTTYEIDNADLSTASYFVNSERKWAVSSVGRFVDANNGTYIENSLSQFTGTLESELFQDARVSPSSLRYYGLGLENGNYTVKLQFAETKAPAASTWQTLGRRVFDIYIQGLLEVKDFDLKRETGGVFLRTAEKQIFANVTQNYLEIHLFWAGKGTCCIPTQGYYGPLISALIVTPNFNPTVSNRLPGTSSSKNKKGLISGLVVGITVLCVLIVSGIFIWRRRKLAKSIDDEEVFLGLAVKPDIFTYAELRSATTDFDPINKLGEGGFGAVFKGALSDGRIVAVKQLSVTSHQGKQQFVAEIATISAVQHRNLVKLYGCCIEGARRLLVYEYLEHKSLDQALFGKNELHLDWSSRFTICLGTARGLAYLHEESSVRVVHRDVKASNILLDKDLNPKISDFGLAKLYDDQKTHISTRVAGTIGYLAPEYALRGQLTEKADVFGFGVVALEIISGRANTDATLGPEKMYLLEWAWQLHENNNELELVDKSLSSYNKEEAMRMIGVALACTQTSPMLRPPMSRIVSMLAGDIDVIEVSSRPSYLTEWQFRDGSGTFSSDYTGSSSTGPGGNQDSAIMNESLILSPSQRPMLLGDIRKGR